MYCTVLTRCRLLRPEYVQSEWNLPQSVNNYAESSSSYDRSACRPRDLHSVSRAAVPASCQSQPRPSATLQTAARDEFSAQHQVTVPRRTHENDGPGVSCPADRHSTASNDHRWSANYAYDSCIAAITRQQVDSLMARCHRTHRTSTDTARNVRQNPTVVWPPTVA